jgi:hypothetical protein
MSSQKEFDDTQREQAGRNQAGMTPAADAADPELDSALRNFRSSVHAWSEAEFARPRVMAPAARLSRWRLATGWALGCVLVAGGLSGAVLERNHQRELAQMAQARAAQQQRELATRKAKEEEDLLAKVDSDVSRDVPSAMEPLAQLMGDDGTE